MGKPLFDEVTFLYGQHLREKFKSGMLPKEWRREYPQLFNDHDLRLTAVGSSYLFFEWLGAVLLFHATGYVSYHKWDCKNHQTKHAIFCDLASPELVKATENTSGCPDLLAVSPNSSDWFFCEVKGKKDKLSKAQQHVARMILKSTGRRVVIMHLLPVNYAGYFTGL